MRKTSFLLAIIILLLFLTACDGGNANPEYEVISATTYTVIIGKDENGPIEETRIVFIYMDNGNPKMIKDYYKDNNPTYSKNILIGDTNKYVIVNGYRYQHQYLYLTKETYDSLFPDISK